MRILLLLFGFFFLLRPQVGVAQHITLSDSSFTDGSSQVEVRFPWKYQRGDNPDWANVDFDDKAWQTVQSTFISNTPAANDWLGIGWFRLHLRNNLPSDSIAVGMLLEPYGAAEVYLNGQLVHRYGNVNKDANFEVRQLDDRVKSLPMQGEGPHVLAVRVSNARAHAYLSATDRIGFQMWLGDATAMIAASDTSRRSHTAVPMFFLGLFLALAFINLMLYLTNLEESTPIYVALTCLTVMVTTVIHHHEVFFGTLQDIKLWSTPALAASVAVSSVGGLRLTYSMFAPRLPLFFFLAFIVGLLLSVWPFFTDHAFEIPLMIFGLFLYLEHVRVVFTANRNSMNGSRMLTWGTIAFSISLIYLLLLQLGYIPTNSSFASIPYVMAAILLGSYTLHFTGRHVRESIKYRKQFYELRETARTQMEEALKSRAEDLQKLLFDNEYQRKVQQLDKARKVQTSFLPVSLPSHPKLEMHGLMKTAPEPSGTLYDVHLDEDGTLTAMLADATGHAMHANTVVASAKSLFSLLAPLPSLSAIFGQMQHATKHVSGGEIDLGLLLLKIQNNTLNFTSAHMPSVLIYRSASRQAEVIGPVSFGDHLHHEIEHDSIHLQSGDAVLLSTTGLSGRQDGQGRMFGLDRLSELFTRIMTEERDTSDSIEEILQKLQHESDKWALQLPPQEDQTMLLLRHK